MDSLASSGIANQELPLQINHHCNQMFELVDQAIADNCHWQLVESVAG